MADKTEIEWTEATWNPMRGCRRVSEGCRHCYAETAAGRFCGEGQPYEGLAERTQKGPRWTGKGMMVEKVLDQPLRWTRPRKIFVNSMSDVFFGPFSFEQIAQVFAVMLLCHLLGKKHTFQLLTKRPKRMLEWFTWAQQQRQEGSLLRFLPEDIKASRFMRQQSLRAMLGGAQELKRSTLGPWPLPNLWLGVSVEDQRTANARIPLLLQAPAAVRWLSMEPLLGPVDISQWCLPWDTTTVDWVVVGGESGSKARPMCPVWVRSLRDQCVDAGAFFFFKQWGRWAPTEDIQGEQNLYAFKSNGGLAGRGDGEFLADLDPSKHIFMRPVGKKAAGRLLDGRTWDDYPWEGYATSEGVAS